MKDKVNSDYKSSDTFYDIQLLHKAVPQCVNILNRMEMSF